MNKKIFRIALYCALAAATTGMVNSCTDYAEDIADLQSQVDALSTKVDALQAAINGGAVITSVTSSTNGVTVTLSNGKSFEITNGVKGDKGDKGDTGAAGTNGTNGKDGTVVTVSEDGFLVLDGKKTTTKVAGSVITIDEEGFVCIDGKKSEYKLPKNVVTAVMDENTLTIKGASEEDIVINLNSEIGYISAYPDEYTSYSSTSLKFSVYTEQANTFGPNKEVTFVAGNTRTTTQDIVVRVSPTNAKVEAEALKFINSKGEVLEDVVVTEVKPFETLLTKAASANGLYTLTVKLAEGVAVKDFSKLVVVGAEKKSVRFALAAENTKGGKAISGYAYSFAASDATAYATIEDITVDANTVKEIRNRATFSVGETTTPDEYVWLDSEKPAVAPIYEDDANKKLKKNVTVGDNRTPRQAAATSLNKDIVIKFAKDIKGFYVTLDNEKNAIESAPSEWNAWTSYSYTGLNTYVEGNTGAIQVNSGAAYGDEIGFRIFAANLDGTLVDPDGIAFYVLVGDDTKPAANITATIEAKKAEVETDFIAVDCFENANKVTEWAVPTVNGKPAADKADVEIPVFTVKYFDKDKKPFTPAAEELAKVKFVKFSTTNIALYEDGETFTQSIKLSKNVNGTDFDLKTITAAITKVMPTATVEVEFRPKQETVDGSNDFIAYMVPGTNDGSALAHYNASTTATKGSKNLNNVFYNIDPTTEFTFAKAGINKDPKKGYTEPVTVTVTDNFLLTINAALIDNTTKHDVTLAKVYKETVSKVWDAKAKEYKTSNYKVASAQKLTVTFACWESASTYYWADKLDDKDNKIGTMQPMLEWTATGGYQTASLKNVLTTNTYNDPFFGRSLYELCDNGLLVNAGVDPVLKAGSQVNPYFKPSIEGQTVYFTQNDIQVDSAPVADHDEQLVISLKDAFGHSVPVVLDVTILKPTK